MSKDPNFVKVQPAFSTALSFLASFFLAEMNLFTFLFVTFCPFFRMTVFKIMVDIV